MNADLKAKCIEDFGDQWSRYRGNDGFYGSLELLQDMFGPILNVADISGSRVADIGSGTGRIVSMLLAAGAVHVTAIEPSVAFDVLQENTRPAADQVTLIQSTGEAIPESGQFDMVFSIGVLHHIPDPAPVVAAAYRALRPGGRICIWLYGREGNETYLAIIEPLRALTKRVPHWLLSLIVRLLDLPLMIYVWLCKFLRLPLSHYMRNVVSKLSGDKRRLTVYDQLNPAHAKYYTQSQAKSLLEDAGFSEISLYHRHGYSWSLTGVKSASPPAS